MAALKPCSFILSKCAFFRVFFAHPLTLYRLPLIPFHSISLLTLHTFRIASFWSYRHQCRRQYAQLLAQVQFLSMPNFGIWYGNVLVCMWYAPLFPLTLEEDFKYVHLVLMLFAVAISSSSPLFPYTFVRRGSAQLRCSTAHRRTNNPLLYEWKWFN